MHWYVIIIIFLLAGGFVYRAMKGVAKNIDDLFGALNDLLKRGYDGGFLIINISYSRKFLQVRKYINSRDEYGIELAFPKSPWSLPYFDAVKEFCRHTNQSSHIAGDEVLDFLYVDFGRDVSKADECIKGILTEVFGVSSVTTLFVKLENATVDDEL